MPKGGNGLWKKNSSKRGGQRGHKIFDGRPLPISFLVSIVVFAIGHLVYSLTLIVHLEYFSDILFSVGLCVQLHDG